MPLRDEYKLRSSDLRKILGVAPATLNEIFRKQDVDDKLAKNGATKSISNADVRKIFESRGFSFPKKAEVISFICCKGGTAKTSSCYQTSVRLSQCGSRVLSWDGDSQGNLSTCYHKPFQDFEFAESTPVFLDVITGEQEFEDVLIEVTENLTLLPSTPANSTLDSAIERKFKNQSIAFAKYINRVRDQFDYILIDCAPVLNTTNLGIIAASDKIVIPLNSDDFSALALRQTLEEIKNIRDEFKLGPVDVKILLTRIDGREHVANGRFIAAISETLDKEAEDRLGKKYLRCEIANTVIASSTDIKKTIASGDDLFATRSRAKDDYDQFARDLVGLTDFEKGRRGRKGAAKK